MEEEGNSFSVPIEKIPQTNQIKTSVKTSLTKE
jgi:hypothetical protein